MRKIFKKCKILLFALAFVLGGALVSCSEFMPTFSGNSSLSGSSSSASSASENDSSASSMAKDSSVSSPADKDSLESSDKQSDASSPDESSSENSSTSPDSSSDNSSSSSDSSSSSSDSSSQTPSVPDGFISLTVYMHDVSGSVSLTVETGASLETVIESNFETLRAFYLNANTGAGTESDYNVSFFKNGFWQKDGGLMFLDETFTKNAILAFTPSGVGFNVRFYLGETIEPSYYPIPPLSLHDFVEWMFRNDLFSMNFENSLTAGVWEINNQQTTDAETIIAECDVRFTRNEDLPSGGDDGILQEFIVYGVQLYSATDPDGATKVSYTEYSTPITVEQIYNEFFASAEEYYTFTLYKNGERVSRDETITSDCCIVGVIDEIQESWNFSVQVTFGEILQTYTYSAPVSVLDVAQTFCDEYSLGDFEDYLWYENEQIAFAFNYEHLFVSNRTMTAVDNTQLPNEPTMYEFTYYIDDGNGAAKSTVMLSEYEINFKTFAKNYMDMDVKDERLENEYAYFASDSGMNELDSTTYINAGASIWAIKRSALPESYTVTYTVIPAWGSAFQTFTQEIGFPLSRLKICYMN